jgi:hypothetical protein
MTNVANFVLIQDHGSTLPTEDGPEVEFPIFNAPGAVSSQSVLAFRLAVTGADVELQIEFNGANLVGRKIVPPGPERTFHELISATEVRDQANLLTMNVARGGGQATVSDVVLWYQRSV